MISIDRELAEYRRTTAALWQLLTQHGREHLCSSTRCEVRDAILTAWCDVHRWTAALAWLVEGELPPPFLRDQWAEFVGAGDDG